MDAENSPSAFLMFDKLLACRFRQSKLISTIEMLSGGAHAASRESSG